MVSKHHARISLQPAGYTITDLNSTNGVWVNGEKVSTGLLKHGDVIRLGATELTFEEAGGRAPAQARKVAEAIERPRLMTGKPEAAEEFRLASDMVVGKGLTSDLRLDDPSVSSRHARIFCKGEDFYVEDLGSEAGTSVNGVPVVENSPVKLRHGDAVRFGEVELRFELD